jgi:hypothetical protein
MTHSTQLDRNAELREANSCMALGAGLGVAGTGTALLAGATCPLCVVIAPALFGFGVWKRISMNWKCGGDSERMESES